MVWLKNNIYNIITVNVKNFFIFLFIIFSFFNSQAQSKKQIAMTLDDLPASYFGIPDTSLKNRSFIKIMSTLQKFNVRVMGFVTSRNLYPESERLLEKFVENGNQIGNHTHSHLDLNQTSSRDYINDILECQKYISKYINGKKYFRYSLLHRGNTIAKRDSVYSFLHSNYFTIVPVSIDNDEWKYNQLFADAMKANDTVKARQIATDYINHMIKMTNYFDSLSNSIVHRNIKHILLLHLNYINAIYLEDLLNWYVTSGWEFISVDEALTDPIYKMKETYIGKRGLSYIKRILYPPETD